MSDAECFVCGGSWQRTHIELLRAEVERLTEANKQITVENRVGGLLHKATIAERDHLRSQLSARDAEVDQLKKDLLRQMAWKTEAQDELEDICNELPGVAFMDPPDGGSVTIAEQVRRMYAALLARDAQVMGLKKYIKHNHGCAAISWREGAVHCTCGLDDVLTGEPGPGGEE